MLLENMLFCVMEIIWSVIAILESCPCIRADIGVLSTTFTVASVCRTPPEYALIHVENPGSGLSPSSCPQETAAIPAARHNIVLKRPLTEVLMARNADVSVLPKIVKFTYDKVIYFFRTLSITALVPALGI